MISAVPLPRGTLSILEKSRKTCQFLAPVFAGAALIPPRLIPAFPISVTSSITCTTRKTEYLGEQLPTIFSKIGCYCGQPQRGKPPNRCRQLLRSPQTVYNGGISRLREVPTDHRHSLPMGIRFSCPNGHKLNVKAHLAGKRAICPHCGSKVVVPEPPAQTEAPASAKSPGTRSLPTAAVPALELGSIDLLPSSILPHTAAEHVQISSGTADTLPESILPTTVHSLGVEPAKSPAESSAQAHHTRGRRNQLIVSVVLLLIVILLAFALYWVLNRHISPTPPAPAEATTPSTASTTAEPPNSATSKAAAQNTTTKQATTPTTVPTDAVAPVESAPPKKE